MRSPIAATRYLRNHQTPSEIRLWEHLRRRQVSRFRFLRQHEIRFELDGRQHFFVADFYCAKGQLIIEVDGPIHDDAKERDQERDQLLSLLGYTVLRFSNDEVDHEVERVVERIRTALEEKA